MAIKFSKENKEIKARTSKPGKWCTVTLVIQIVLTLGLGGLALAPFLTYFAGAMMYLFFGIAFLAVSICTLFLALLSKGYRDWWNNAFGIASKFLSGAGDALKAIKPYMTWLPFVFLAASSCGFVYNLIYFNKHEKANKGRFITSCIFLGICVVNVVIGIIVYTTVVK